MNEYRVAVPKGNIQGYAQDPNQNVSNAGSVDLNAPLTASNAAGVLVAGVYGKKILSKVYSVVVDQLGSGQLEVATFIGKKALTFVAIGIATGGTGLLVAIGAEAITTGIDYAVSGHKITLENDDKIAERGTRKSFGVGYYG